jgi:hypothetical protein
MDRRQFATLAGVSLGSLLTRKIWAEQAHTAISSGKFYFALIADTHIIDNFYVKGSENGIEDNESILVTTPRLIAARDLINSLNPAIEQVFLIGDYFQKRYAARQRQGHHGRLSHAGPLGLRQPRLRCPPRSS